MTAALRQRSMLRFTSPNQNTGLASQAAMPSINVTSDAVQCGLFGLSNSLGRAKEKKQQAEMPKANAEKP
jgi:hypothetical protein